MLAKQAINDKLQGSVATYLRCGGVLKTKFRKVYCWVCEWIIFFKSVITAKVTIKNVLSRALVRLANILLKDGESQTFFFC